MSWASIQTSSACIYLCEEEQVFSDGEVVEEHVVLRTQTQAAADQSHVLTYVVTANVRTAAAGREKAWEWRDKESLNDVKNDQLWLTSVITVYKYI